MNIKRLPLLLLSVLFAAACGNYVVAEGGGAPESAKGNGNGNSNGSGGGTGSGGSGSGMEYPAVALTRAQLDVLWDEYWQNNDPSGSSSSSGGDGNLNPDDLFLRVSDLGATCNAPTTDIGCGGHWHLSIALPPALQQVGVYDLESPELLAYSYMSETGDLHQPPVSNEDCSYGGGSLGSGTLEILSIDENEVHFRVELTGGIWEADPSGEYTAPRCPVDP